MRTSEFCYWLQGYFALSKAEELTVEQVDEIKKHLQLVFVYDLDPKQIKDKLQQIHDGGLTPPPTTETVYRC